MSIMIPEKIDLNVPVTAPSIDELEAMFPVEELDKNVKAHIISPPENVHIFEPGMSARDIVDIARTTGQEVVALCGHRWVPTGDPDKHDVCGVCMKMAEILMREAGE